MGSWANAAQFIRRSTRRATMLTRILIIPALVATTSLIMAPVLADNEGDEIPFSRTKIIIEFNASAEDVGVQVLLDGDPWKRLMVFDPNERRILEITGRRSLSKQGFTELFFESSEPSLADLPLEKFLARFPAGEYEFEGVTIDGTELQGTAVLTHVIPAGPEIVSPVSPNDDPPLVDPNNLVIEWKPVTETITGSDDIEITGYQVIVEQVEPRRIFSIDLPASAHSVRVPLGFLVQAGTLHKFEVLAIEAGGNQTITEGEFLTP